MMGVGVIQKTVTIGGTVFHSTTMEKGQNQKILEGYMSPSLHGQLKTIEGRAEVLICDTSHGFKEGDVVCVSSKGQPAFKTTISAVKQNTLVLSEKGTATEVLEKVTIIKPEVLDVSCACVQLLALQSKRHTTFIFEMKGGRLANIELHPSKVYIWEKGCGDLQNFGKGIIEKVYIANVGTKPGAYSLGIIFDDNTLNKEKELKK